MSGTQHSTILHPWPFYDSTVVDHNLQKVFYVKTHNTFFPLLVSFISLYLMSHSSNTTTKICLSKYTWKKLNLLSYIALVAVVRSFWNKCRQWSFSLKLFFLCSSLAGHYTRTGVSAELLVCQVVLRLKATISLVGLSLLAFVSSNPVLCSQHPVV